MFAMGNWNADTQIYSNLPCHRNTAAEKKNVNFKFGCKFCLIFWVIICGGPVLAKKKHIFSSFRIWASPRWKINIFVLSFRNRSIVCRAKGRVVSTGANYFRFQCITSFVVTEPILEPRFPQENQVKVVLVVLLSKWSSIFRMVLACLSEARPGFAIKGACPGALHKLPVTKSNAYIFTKMTRGLPSCVAASIFCFMKFGRIMVCWSAAVDISFLHGSCRLRETWRKGLSKAGN